MRKILVGLAAVMLAGAVAADSALASCAGPGSFQVCASMSVGNVRFDGGVWKFDLTVTNLFPGQGLSHHIKAAGIGTSQAITSWALVAATRNGTNVLGPSGGGWTAASGNSNLIGGQLDLMASSGASKAGYGGDVLVLTFSTNVALDVSAVNSLGWHSGDVDGTGCSIWANTDGQYVGGDEPECGGSTVPEPISMVLLGTGLAGIGALRRRRKGLDIENG